MSKKERKLTPAEQRRKAAYQELSAALEQQGYEKRELTIGVLAANLGSLLLTFPLILALIWAYYLIHPEGSAAPTLLSSAFFLPLLLALIVLHEGLHGLTWACFVPGHLRSVQFGIIWKSLNPYCTCSQPMKRWQYVLGSLMPTLVLGFGLSAAAVALGRLWLLAIAGLMLLAGGADLLIALRLVFFRSRGRPLLCCDHPYACGLAVFQKSKPQP